jgi:predicted O-linked N-acetylglucosamine transferase (SPINDLY family)
MLNSSRSSIRQREPGRNPLTDSTAQSNTPPVTADTLNTEGNAHYAQGRFEAAQACFEAALTLAPESAPLHANMATSLLLQGKRPEAMHFFYKAVQLWPHLGGAQPSYLCAMSTDPLVPTEQYLHGAKAYAQLMSAAATPYSQWPLPYDPLTTPGAPWRVGLVSGNFQGHPVGHFLESLLKHIPPERVQFFAYPTQNGEDDLTRRIRPAFTHWQPLAGMRDAEAARKIHSHGLHILLDLDGYTLGNRLPVFAWRPAALQATWLGYWASTGMPEMDFVLADETSAPASAAQDFTENIFWLPHTRLCFTPPEGAPEPRPPPCIANGYTTFGGYLNMQKLHDGVLQLWSRVLAAVPGSRLRLGSRDAVNDAMVAAFTHTLRRHGISPSRVDVAPPLSRQDYLAGYGEVDMVIDTFPATGGTTTCEALWMGVPTVTLAGHNMISRQCAGMLACVGLHDWIAKDEADFVRRAAHYAAHPQALSLLRTTLRERTQRSALCDAPRFAKALEQALALMWGHKWRGKVGRRGEEVR